MADDAPTVSLALYSRALDEIYALRAALAYEARVVDVHLSYKTFPKSRRTVAEEQVRRMEQASRGGVDLAYADTSSSSLRSALYLAGAKETLTRHAWEAEHA